MSLFPVVHSNVQARQWDNYTNVQRIMAMASTSDTLWMATTGGLAYLVTDHPDRVVRLTNADGLGENDLRFVTVGGNGRVWTGGAAGRLSRRRHDQDWRVYSFVDENDRPIELAGATEHEEFLWVASEIGVHKFDIERHGGEIKETYTRIGGWPDNAGASDAMIVNDTLWLAGEAGIARAPADDPFLLIRDHWTTWSPAGHFLAIAEFQGSIYAGGSEGLYRLTDTAGAEWVNIASGPFFNITDLQPDGDTLRMATSVGTAACYSDICPVRLVPGARRLPFTSILVMPDQSLWLAQPDSALWCYTSGEWSDFVFDGPLENHVRDVAIDNSGKTWCMFPFTGAAYYDQDHWTKLPYFEASPNGPGETIEVAPSGDVWLGHSGAGAYRVNPDVPLADTGWIRFDSSNSDQHTLMWINEDRPKNIVRISDIVVNSRGVVWFANTFADSGRAIAFDIDDCWGVVDSSDGVVLPGLDAVLAVASNTLYVGTLGDGLIEITHSDNLCVGGQPSTASPSVTYYTIADQLPSNDVLSILVDRLDSLWIGTTLGLAKWEPRFRRFVDVPLPSDAGLIVNALAADAANGIWVGTSLGLTHLPGGEFPEFYNSTNSGFVGDNVQTITVDERTGDLWIGTRSGLSRTSGPPPASESIDDIIVYPNPVEITSDTDPIVRFTAAPGSHIYLFTLDGRALADFPSHIGWNGRNASGRFVSSGIYLYVVRDAEGQTGRGKIAVINRR